MDNVKDERRKICFKAEPELIDRINRAAGLDRRIREHWLAKVASEAADREIAEHARKERRRAHNAGPTQTSN